MLAHIAANAVLMVHAAFIIFAVLGGFLALRWRWMPWLHLPCMVWAATVVGMGWICPLTPLENRLRMAAGQAGYEGGFIEHYLLAAIYPDGLTRSVQIGLAIVVVVINLAAYGLVLRKRT
ncbi:MAG: DUF2784 domain-containing protein [Burkholderiaceae bacterium]